MPEIKRKYIYVIAGLVVLLIVFELLPRILLSPNLIEIDGNKHFLIKTSWNQTGEYAKYVEHDTDAGCWATAIAQIAHFHKLSPSGKVEYITTRGMNISVNFDEYIFEHGMFDKELIELSSYDAKEQVAKYIYCIAALIYTDFGSQGYIEHETMPARLASHLNCDVEFHEYKKQQYLSDKIEIEQLIKKEIDENRPLMIYFDNGDDFGHAAVLDAYARKDESFLVHLNMGWGGQYDGWYNAFDKFIGIRDDLQNRFLLTFDPRNDIR